MLPYLFTLRQLALPLLPQVVLLLLLSSETQRQVQGLWQDVGLPRVCRKQGELHKLLLFVDAGRMKKIGKKQRPSDGRKV